MKKDITINGKTDIMVQSIGGTGMRSDTILKDIDVAGYKIDTVLI